ncbi:MAG: histidine ammonia-lyase [Gammaproteobacteria bacterium]|nr:histidine ammonia-lyase [Gammaproteobacteria bacterium]
MDEPIELNSISDMTLINADKVAFDRARVSISNEAAERIARGRARFERFMDTKGGYVYGATTAPGARAKVVLSPDEASRQGLTLRNFVPIQAGIAREMLSERCVRLAVYARLSNAMTGAGKLRTDTVQAVANLLNAVPPVPLQGVSCSGEVMPLTWLMAPLADLPLARGEAMALINGSPFSTAMACDVALTAARRVRVAEHIFALSVEASGCPAAHFDRRLAEGWKDPYYEQSLNDLHNILKDSVRNQLNYQAPTSWRVLPNVLASALRAIAEMSQAAELGLQSLKDNPTFVQSTASDAEDVVISSGGYHDHRAAKAIDQINSALIDLCVLSSRQVAHLLDGGGLGLPPLLARTGDGVGAEYLVWGMTEPLEAARCSAGATTLNMGLQDPAGNQSDVVSLAFTAYGKHREVVRSVDACFASLAVAAMLALRFRDNVEVSMKSAFNRHIHDIMRSAAAPADAVGEPLRRINTLLQTSADHLPTVQFAQMFLDVATATSPATLRI